MRARPGSRRPGLAQQDAELLGGCLAEELHGIAPFEERDALSGCPLEFDRPDLAAVLLALEAALELLIVVERALDDNEQLQRRLQREQDGSEIRSVELERATREGISLLERRDTMEFFREAAAEQFRILLRKAWAPRTGSRAHRRAMTASLIDSRDFLDARLREKAAALLPEGTRIAFTGGSDTGDHNAVWTALDKVRARHVDMILLHGAAPTGA